MEVAPPAEAPPAPTPSPVAAQAYTGPPIRSLKDIADLADRNRDMALKVLIKKCVRPVKIEQGHIDVSLTPEAPRTLLNDLSTKLHAWTGVRWVVSLSREQGSETLSEIETGRRETMFLDAQNDPTVAAILSRFPGSKVIDVRIPDAPEMDIAEGDVPPPPEDDNDGDDR
jgi:DNA polymerase III subunit gamma/tau